MIKIDPRSTHPYYEQIISAIKQQCLAKVLLPGDKLPSVREMAGTILVNPNTISKAYQELERQGVIETLRGKGTYIAERQATPLNKELELKLQKQLEEFCLEALYLEIPKETLTKWIEDNYQKLKKE
ncbi:GntR family transcriptional regulator [Carnobacterium divergens]|uniref:GntR family transcriptional regulator n=1 Tax=Carnobacterium divergens TaxID=2748 RepID=UPI0010717895|nr:GntR family transcriptional regulator [Carnobacterium divergens]TFJ45263.1 GntR family transcriptional regulator [Carnobacterium divergens]TFJ51720.1 GntR family transcriptional regulator [Carnobacterium divergens]